MTSGRAKALQLRQQLLELAQRVGDHSAKLDNKRRGDRDNGRSPRLHLEEAATGDAEDDLLVSPSSLWGSIDLEDDCRSETGAANFPAPAIKLVAPEQPAAEAMRFLCTIAALCPSSRKSSRLPRDRPFARMVSGRWLHVGNAKWSRRFELDGLHRNAAALADDVAGWCQRACSGTELPSLWQSPLLSIIGIGRGSCPLASDMLRTLHESFYGADEASWSVEAAWYLQASSTSVLNAIEAISSVHSGTGSGHPFRVAAALDELLCAVNVQGVAVVVSFHSKAGARSRVASVFANGVHDIGCAVAAARDEPFSGAVTRNPLALLLRHIRTQGFGGSGPGTLWALGCVPADPERQDMQTLAALSEARQQALGERPCIQKPSAPQDASLRAPAEDDTGARDMHLGRNAQSASSEVARARVSRVEVRSESHAKVLQVKLLAAANLASIFQDRSHLGEGLRRVIVNVRLGRACTSLGPFDCDAWRDPIWDADPLPGHLFELPLQAMPMILEVEVSCAVPAGGDARMSLGRAVTDVTDMVPLVPLRLWLPLLDSGGAVKVELCTAFKQGIGSFSHGQAAVGSVSTSSLGSCDSSSSPLSPCSVFADSNPSRWSWQHGLHGGPSVEGSGAHRLSRSTHSGALPVV